MLGTKSLFLCLKTHSWELQQPPAALRLFESRACSRLQKGAARPGLSGSPGRRQHRPALSRRRPQWTRLAEGAVAGPGGDPALEQARCPPLPTTTPKPLEVPRPVTGGCLARASEGEQGPGRGESCGELPVTRHGLSSGSSCLSECPSRRTQSWTSRGKGLGVPGRRGHSRLWWVEVAWLSRSPEGSGNSQGQHSLWGVTPRPRALAGGRALSSGAPAVAPAPRHTGHLGPGSYVCPGPWGWGCSRGLGSPPRRASR